MRAKLVGVRLVSGLVAACAASILSANAATWYVDNAASGLNNGTSWANAWTAFSSISWGSVAAGDTIYISGGSTSKSYTSTLTIGKSGTSNARLTIAKGVDSGHNGRVIFQGNPATGAGPYIEATGLSYITLDGIDGRDNFNTQTATFNNFIMAPSSTALWVKNCTWSNINNCVNVSAGTQFWITNCVAVQTRGDAVVRASSVSGNGYTGGGIIENCDFEVAVNSIDGGGPDGIQTGNNITARNNTFRVRRVTGFYTSNQHPDMFQCPGVFIAIYNNDFINVGDCSISPGAWWVGSVHQNILIYNNIFRILTPIDPFPEYIRLYNGVGEIADISNFVIANNLFIDNPTWVNVLFTQYGPNGGNPTGSGNFIVNNIWYNSGQGACWRLDQSSRWTSSTWTINNNIYYPGSESVMRHYGTLYTAPDWIAANESQGSVSQPKFVSYTKNNANNNFHLLSTDTAATGNGRDMSAKFTIDKDGLTRTVPWSRGAYKAPTSPTPNLPPNTPVNSSPLNNATGVSLTPTLSASSYSDPQGSSHSGSQFRITASDGVTLVWDSGVLAAVTSKAVPSSTITYLTAYKFQVRYLNALGLWSTWSTLTTFTTLAPTAPNTPSNTSPANGATDVTLSPTLTASAYSDTSSSAQSGSQWLLMNGTNVIDSGTYPAVTSYTIPIVLSNSTTYTWQVRYKNGYDLWSAYSTATSFTTTNSASIPDPPPPPPPPPAPVAPSTPSNVTPTNGAVNVSLQPILYGSVYSDPQGSPQAASQWIVSHAGTNLFDSGTYTVATNYPLSSITLSNFSNYGWQVRYQNTHGLWSDYSTQTFFTTTNQVIAPNPPPPSTNPPITPPPVILPMDGTNTLIFRGTIIFQGKFEAK